MQKDITQNISPTANAAKPTDTPLLAQLLPTPIDSTSYYYYNRLQDNTEADFWFRSLYPANNEPIGVLGHRNVLLRDLGKEPLSDLPKVESAKVVAEPIAAPDSANIAIDSVITLADTAKSAPVVVSDSIMPEPSYTLHYADSVVSHGLPAQASTLDALAVAAELANIADSTAIANADAKVLEIAPVDSLPTDSIVVDSLALATDSIAVAGTKEFTEQPAISKFAKNLNVELEFADGYIIGILFSVFLLTVAKLSFARQFGHLWASFISYADSYKIYRNSSFLLHQFYRVTGMVVYVNISLFFAYIFKYLEVDISPYGSLVDYSLVFVAAVLLILMQNLLLRTLGQMFMSYRIAEEYWFQVSTINRLAAIVALPALAVLPYLASDWSIYGISTVLAIGGLAYVFRILRAMRLASEKQVSIVYMIFYFCTLEIMPLVVLYKFFVITWM